MPCLLGKKKCISWSTVSFKVYIFLMLFCLDNLSIDVKMGNTCKSMADSCQCMAKTTTIL